MSNVVDFWKEKFPAFKDYPDEQVAGFIKEKFPKLYDAAPYQAAPTEPPLPADTGYDYEGQTPYTSEVPQNLENPVTVGLRGIKTAGTIFRAGTYEAGKALSNFASKHEIGFEPETTLPDTMDLGKATKIGETPPSNPNLDKFIQGDKTDFTPAVPLGADWKAAWEGKPLPSDQELSDISPWADASKRILDDFTEMVPSIGAAGVLTGLGLGAAGALGAGRLAAVARGAAHAIPAGAIFGSDKEGNIDPKSAILMGAFPAVGSLTEKMALPVLTRLGLIPQTEAGYQAAMTAVKLAGAQAYMMAMDAPEYLDPNVSKQQKLEKLIHTTAINVGFALHGILGLKSLADREKLSSAMLAEAQSQKLNSLFYQNGLIPEGYTPSLNEVPLGQNTDNATKRNVTGDLGPSVPEGTDAEHKGIKYTFTGGEWVPQEADAKPLAPDDPVADTLNRAVDIAKNHQEGVSDKAVVESQPVPPPSEKPISTVPLAQVPEPTAPPESPQITVGAMIGFPVRREDEKGVLARDEDGTITFERGNKPAIIVGKNVDDRALSEFGIVPLNDRAVQINGSDITIEGTPYQILDPAQNWIRDSKGNVISITLGKGDNRVTIRSPEIVKHIEATYPKDHSYQNGVLDWGGEKFQNPTPQFDKEGTLTGLLATDARGNQRQIRDMDVAYSVAIQQANEQVRTQVKPERIEAEPIPTDVSRFYREINPATVATINVLEEFGRRGILPNALSDPEFTAQFHGVLTPEAIRVAERNLEHVISQIEQHGTPEESRRLTEPLYHALALLDRNKPKIKLGRNIEIAPQAVKRTTQVSLRGTPLSKEEVAKYPNKQAPNEQPDVSVSPIPEAAKADLLAALRATQVSPEATESKPVEPGRRTKKQKNKEVTLDVRDESGDMVKVKMDGEKILPHLEKERTAFDLLLECLTK